MTEPEPVNMEEDLSYPKWISSVNEELESIEKNINWEVVNLPKGKKPNVVKWMSKVKANPKGEILNHKARLLANGFLQRECIDFEEVFASLAMIETIRLVVDIVNNHNCLIHQMDVNSAFLNRPLEEEVYVGHTSGFVVRNQELKVYKLKNTLYGLKQAPRDWNKRIYGFLKDVGFNKCVLEHGVYVKINTGE